MVDISIEDRVAFSRRYLRAIGAVTGWAPFARGVVTQVTKLSRSSAPPIVSILWDDGSASSALATNLVREDRLHAEIY
jgi:hypothetical protein